VDGAGAAPHHSGLPLTRHSRALQPERPQVPAIAERPERLERDEGEPASGSVRARAVRLLLVWAVVAAGLFLLRRPLEDPFWRVLLLPLAFAAVVALGVVTVRLARVRIGERRRAERREAERRHGEAAERE
jgi:hypothetical protein